MLLQRLRRLRTKPTARSMLRISQLLLQGGRQDLHFGPYRGPCVLASPGLFAGEVCGRGQPRTGDRAIFKSYERVTLSRSPSAGVRSRPRLSAPPGGVTAAHGWGTEA